MEDDERKAIKEANDRGKAYTEKEFGKLLYKGRPKRRFNLQKIIDEWVD
jgi:hypothetical protein